MTHIQIPIRLANEANSREHWLKKGKRHTMQKFIVRAYMNNAFPLGSYPMPCIILLTSHAPRKKDDDNNIYNFKWIRDAISEFLLECDKPGGADNDARIQWHYAQKKSKPKEYFITIEVWPVDSFGKMADFCPIANT